MLGFSRDIAPALIDVIYCCLLYLVLVVSNYRIASSRKIARDFSITGCQSSREVSRSRQIILLLLSTLLVITAFSSGEFYHYKGLVEYGHSLDGEDLNHLEDIYSVIISYFNRNYVIFRVIVFGPPILLFALTMKRFIGEYYFPLFLLIATLSSNFSYSRTSLAFACFFVGLYNIICILVYHKNIIYHVAVGFIFCILSISFHRSSILLVCLLPFLFVPIKKNTVVLICLLFAIISLLLKETFDALLVGDISSDEIVQGRLASLSTFSRHGSTFQQLLRRFFNFGSILIPFFFITKSYTNNLNRVPLILRYLFKITMAIILISISTLTLGFDNIVLFYRILYMAIIPVVCLLCGFWKIGIISPLLYKRLLLFGITSELLERMYGLYFTYNGFIS